MQRQLYPVLLLLAVVLAVAIWLRPSAAEGLLTLAQDWGSSIPSIPYPATSAVDQTGAEPLPPGGPAAPPLSAASLPELPPAFPPGPPPDLRAPALPPEGVRLPDRPAPQLAYPPQTPRLAPNPRPAANPAPRLPPAPAATPCEGAEILAQVGSDVILACDVTAALNEFLAQTKDRIPPDQMEMQRRLLTKELLKQRIQFKLIYQDAKRKIPKENLDKIKEQLSDQFDKVVVPERLKKTGVGSRRELEEKLIQLGTSLERERAAFIERTMAQQWAHEQINVDVEITHDEMLRYYHEHLAEFEHPARARWQQLMIRKSSYPTKAEAHAALAALGNRVLGGAPFEEVAKARSEGIAAPDGGLRDWTTKGALVSEVLDKAIFGLPVNQLSRIFEDDEAFHIVRVLQRDEASVTPFLEAQVKIKEKLAENNRKEQVDQYLARLEQQIPVWTVFDEEKARPQEVSRRPRSWFE